MFEQARLYNVWPCVNDYVFIMFRHEVLARNITKDAEGVVYVARAHDQINYGAGRKLFD